jgi:creatinine amidohydrolase
MNDFYTETMMNLSWKDISDYVEKDAIMLLPLGVIEEHGPHLCVGTDIYTSVIYCKGIQEKLRDNGFESIIAPPFYWGICQSTAGFLGSFSIRMETAKNLLVDILHSLQSFGFKRAFGINAHGDINQNIMILDAFRECNVSTDLIYSYVFPKNIMHHYGITGTESHICSIEPQTIRTSMSEEPDVHAGDIETSIINTHFPDCVHQDIAKALPATKLEDDRIMEWILGGKTKELSPNGYLGNPKAYEAVEIETHINDYVERISQGIMERIRVRA